MYEDIGLFFNDAPRHVSAGKTTEAAFVSNKIRAQELGMLQQKAFIKNRLIKRRGKFYNPVKYWNKENENESQGRRCPERRLPLVPLMQKH